MPIRLQRWLLLACLMVLAFGSAHAQPTAAGFIRLVRVVGDVVVEDTSSGAVRPADATQPITQGYVVRTAAASSVVLVFSNGSTVQLGANSRLDIQQFLQDPFGDAVNPSTIAEEPSVSRTRLQLTQGELIGNIKKLRTDEGSSFAIETPAGAAGIRGTLFRLSVVPNDSGQLTFTLTTVEGEVGYSATGQLDAPQALVGQNQEVVVQFDRDDATGEITLVTPLNEIVPQAAEPAALAEIVAAFEQIAAAIVDLVLTGTNESGGAALPPAEPDDAPPVLGRGNPDLTPGDGSGPQ